MGSMVCVCVCVPSRQGGQQSKGSETGPPISSHPALEQKKDQTSRLIMTLCCFYYLIIQGHNGGPWHARKLQLQHWEGIPGWASHS